MRKAEWGFDGLTFILEHNQGQKDLWSIPFPVGPDGPSDGYLGSPERKRYSDMFQAWTERGILPSEARIKQFWHSYWNGKRWSPCDCKAALHVDCERTF